MICQTVPAYASQRPICDFPSSLATLLVSIQVDTLIRRRLEPLILLDEHYANRPRTSNRAQRKRSGRAKSNAVPWLIRVGPEVRTVDVTCRCEDTKSMYVSYAFRTAMTYQSGHRHLSWQGRRLSSPSSG